MSEEKKDLQDSNEISGNEQNTADSSAENEPEIKAESDTATEPTSAVEPDTVYFGDPSAELNASASDEAQNESSVQEEKKEKKKKKISVKTFVISLIAVAVATLMLTYAICSSVYQAMYAKAYVDANENSFINGNASSTGVSELDVIADIINSSYYGDVDTDKLMEAAIDAYIAQTGDVYAAYYTQEELDAQSNEDLGKTTGIGVNIINSKITYQGAEKSVLKVINVVKNSPAEESGVKIGDYIYSAILDGVEYTVHDLGYEDALNKLLGAEGTTASFVALRENGEEYTSVRFDIVRKSFTSNSVYERIPNIPANADGKVGVIKITNFDYTTPSQFCEKIESLKSQGCEKFVLDVRYNPGGYQTSVQAVLSYFLNEGDVYMRTKDKAGNIESEKIQVVSSFQGEYSGCNVSKEDIGKYKDLDVVVLCNEYTASAGELFVATFKDYSLGEVIGVKTYGKGTMQTTYNLQAYALFKYGVTGVEGAVKLTTHEYYSAKSDSYNGIGIEPNHSVPLSEEAAKLNVYDFENIDKIDDQLIKAINILNGKE